MARMLRLTVIFAAFFVFGSRAADAADCDRACLKTALDQVPRCGGEARPGGRAAVARIARDAKRRRDATGQWCLEDSHGSG